MKTKLKKVPKPKKNKNYRLLSHSVVVTIAGLINGEKAFTKG